MSGFKLSQAPAVSKDQAKMLFLHKLALEQEIAKIDTALKSCPPEVFASSCAELAAEGKIEPVVLEAEPAVIE